MGTESVLALRREKGPARHFFRIWPGARTAATAYSLPCSTIRRPEYEFISGGPECCCDACICVLMLACILDKVSGQVFPIAEKFSTLASCVPALVPAVSAF